MLSTSLRSPGAKLSSLLVSLLGFGLIFSSVTAFAQIVAVGTCDPSLPSYDELQDALDGVPDGGVVELCPGRWAQQVRISNKSLSLTGVQNGNSGLPVLVPPAAGLAQNATGLPVGGFLGGTRIAAQILVTAGATVDISNLALDATNGVPNCSPDPTNALKPVGIYFQHASGSVSRIAARNHLNTCTPAQGGPQGDAVLVQNSTLPSQTAKILNSSFHNFGYMAVEAVANTAGASVNVDSNTLVGPGFTNGNGIYIAFGAGAVVTNNSVSDALRTGDGTSYWGILGQCASSFTASNNTVGNTDTGIAVINNSNNCFGSVYGTTGDTVTNNQVFDSATDGIQVCGTNNLIQNNDADDSSRASINFLQGCKSTNNVATQNRLNGACAAVLVGTDALTNLIDSNDVFNAKFVQLSGGSCAGGAGPMRQFSGTKVLPEPPPSE